MCRPQNITQGFPTFYFSTQKKSRLRQATSSAGDAELPKGVSAVPIYKQLEKLQLINKENEEALLRLKNEGVGSLNRIVGLDTFENFASYYRKLVTRNLDFTQKKQLAQKFVRKVEVGVTSFKIHYIVDSDHYKRELSLKNSAHSFGEKGGHGAKMSKLLGSNTLTFATGQTTDFMTRQFGIMMPIKIHLEFLLKRKFFFRLYVILSAELRILWPSLK